MSMGGVLQGVLVADFTAVMAGSSGSAFLADLGADVIKVEKVDGGDYSRSAVPYLFQAANRNKRSLALDLDSDDGKEVARRLVTRADVMLQGFRPGALERKGLGRADVRALNPMIVYATLSGFGVTGPGADRRGIDHIIQAESGMAKLMGSVNQRLSLIDAATGIAIGQAVLAALLKRERAGMGSDVEVSLYDTSLWLQLLPIAEYGATRVTPQPPEEYMLRIPTIGTFDVIGGQVFVSILQQDHWIRFCELIGERALADDPRFADRASRGVHGAVLKPLLAEALRRCERQVLLDVARREGLMISPLKGYDDVFADPQAASNESFQTVSTFDDEEVVLTRLPYRFLDGEPVDPYRPAPRLGEHTREVLSELGFSTQEADRFVARDAVVAG
jgi:crotonobetainyl-CoA:carnitine CoA-transferase CaiB-like acyl-CoA transferase